MPLKLKTYKNQLIGAAIVAALLAFGFRTEIASWMSWSNTPDPIERIDHDEAAPATHPTITEPVTCKVGELVTISVAGVSGASWSVTPAVPVYVDSNTVSLAFASPREGTFIVFAAVVHENTPTALTTSVSVSETDAHQDDLPDKKDSDQDADPDADTGLEATIRRSLPADVAAREKLANAFDAAIAAIDGKTVISVDGAFAVLRRETIPCLKEPALVKFLDEITGTVRSELTSEGETLDGARALFKRVADAIRPAPKTRDPPTVKASEVSPVIPVRSQAPRSCPTGGCPK